MLYVRYKYGSCVMLDSHFSTRVKLCTTLHETESSYLNQRNIAHFLEARLCPVKRNMVKDVLALNIYE